MPSARTCRPGPPGLRDREDRDPMLQAKLAATMLEVPAGLVADFQGAAGTAEANRLKVKAAIAEAAAGASAQGDEQAGAAADTGEDEGEP